MAYSDFTLAKGKEASALCIEEGRNLFPAIAGVLPSEQLMLTFEENNCVGDFNSRYRLRYVMECGGEEFAIMPKSSLFLRKK